jgi:Beta/Gamma crystallin
MAEIVLFIDANFGGLHTHIYQSTPDFTQLARGGVNSGINGNWNDIVSSFIIESGRWQVFRDINFRVNQGGILGPGHYSFVEDFGIDNDSISSVRLVSP